METKKTKYDTNPLDPDVEKKAEDVWGDLGGVTQQVGGATRDVGNTANDNPRPPAPENARENVYSEAPTRRIDSPPLDAPYPSVFVPPTYAPPPAQYQQQQQQPHSAYQNPMIYSHPSRPVAGFGVPEKWALMMAYAPYVGIVVS